MKKPKKTEPEAPWPSAEAIRDLFGKLIQDPVQNVAGKEVSLVSDLVHEVLEHTISREEAAELFKQAFCVERVEWRSRIEEAFKKLARFVEKPTTIEKEMAHFRTLVTEAERAASGVWRPLCDLSYYLRERERRHE